MKKIGTYKGKTFYRTFQLENDTFQRGLFSVGDALEQQHHPSVSTSPYVYHIVGIYTDELDKPSGLVNIVGLFYRSAKDVCVRGHTTNRAQEVLQTSIYEFVDPDKIIGRVSILKENPKSHEKDVHKKETKYQHRYILEGQEDATGFCPTYTEKSLPQHLQKTFQIPKETDYKEIVARVEGTDNDIKEDDSQQASTPSRSTRKRGAPPTSTIELDSDYESSEEIEPPKKKRIGRPPKNKEDKQTAPKKEEKQSASAKKPEVHHTFVS